MFSSEFRLYIYKGMKFRIRKSQKFAESEVGAASFGIKKLTVFIIYGELPDVYYYSELVSESMQAMPSISTLEP